MATPPSTRHSAINTSTETALSPVSKIHLLSASRNCSNCSRYWGSAARLRSSSGSLFLS
ncbi:MAG: hypothetical protein GXX96_11495 [Planctomycetaceae bacterium]|nr:hypothetical protein [Planctomycetaceae bacterium]